MPPDVFDTIVVGAGAAGCVLAARLSEDPTRRVLLIEAGGRDRSPLYSIPLGIGRLRAARHGLWRYETEPEPHLDGRRLAMATGKVLGGSASINGMIHMAPPDADLDAWTTRGGAAWSAAAMRPAFARVAATLTPAMADAAHPLDAAFLAAAAARGIARHDDPGPLGAEAAGRLRVSIRAGRRHSVRQAYLAAALPRANLALATDTRVLQLAIEGSRALGVVAAQRGERRIIHAGDVVLAAGAVASPHLLQLSGIGPADLLAAAGVEPRHDLPGVGANLQNHVDVAMRYASDAPVMLHSLLRAERILPAMARAWLLGTGPATRFPGEVAAFLKSAPDLPRPDLLAHLVEGLGIRGIRWPLMRTSTDALDREGFSCRVMLLRPESRGRVALRAADPFVAPRVEFGFLSRESEMQRLIAGVRRMRAVFADRAFDDLRGEALEPGPDVQDDAALAAWIRARADMQCHPAGSCAMGTDADAAVDGALRVHGIDGLRIVDASVMPTIVGANTFAATVAIAEHAAEPMR